MVKKYKTYFQEAIKTNSEIDKKIKEAKEKQTYFKKQSDKELSKYWEDFYTFLSKYRYAHVKDRVEMWREAKKEHKESGEYNAALWVVSLLDEEFLLTDLMQNKGLSSFTKKFKKETDGLMGSASKHTKYVQMKVNRKKDTITFTFLTERTPKYPDNFHTQTTDFNKWKLNKDNLYTMEIKFLDVLNKLKEQKDTLSNKDIEDILLNAYIQVWSDVPSFHFQGNNYYMSLNNASIHPTSIPPKHWDQKHHGEQLLDKHLQGLINNIKFYIPQMRQSIKKYLGITK